MHPLQRISKPRIVDFLRLSDKQHWCSPRIRYASIRSKGELCKDILVHFDFVQEGDFIKIRPLHQICNFPDMMYDLKQRQFLCDGRPFDSARVSRENPRFRIEHKKVHLSFGPLHTQQGLGNGIGSAVSAMFP